MPKTKDEKAKEVFEFIVELFEEPTKMLAFFQETDNLDIGMTLFSLGVAQSLKFIEFKTEGKVKMTDLVNRFQKEFDEIDDVFQDKEVDEAISEFQKGDKDEHKD